MAESASTGAGLCVGVEHYQDPKLGPLPAACASAREVADALDPKLVKGVEVMQDVATNDDLFRALQRTLRAARGGAFFFYFAGHALRRGDDLLLALGESEVLGAKGCVPWSDIEDLLKRERVARAVVVLNVDHEVEGAPKAPGVSAEIHVMGSLRVNEAAAANKQCRAYADALLAALSKPVGAAYVEEGALDAEGLGRFLEATAPKLLVHKVFAARGERFELRHVASAAAEAAPSPPAAPKEEAAPPPPREEAPSDAEEERPAPPAAEPPLETVEKPSAAITPAHASRMPYYLIAIAIAVALLYYALHGR